MQVGGHDTEMAHEGREGDVHGRFHDHAAEGNDASGYHRADYPARDCCALCLGCLGCAHERDSFPAWEDSSEFRVMK